MKYCGILLLFVSQICLGQQKSALQKHIDQNSAQYKSWYLQLHASPELSTQEMNTAAYLKEQVRSFGFEITDSLGYHNFAAVLKNGKGPVVLYRTDMDGLPVKEQTGLSYASRATATKNGEQVGVMHACGHDIHMSSWLGIAKFFSEQKQLWSGTLILLAQSAEETGQGAKKVVAASGFSNLPKPDYQLAIHDHAELPAGQAGFCDGYSMAAVDMLNITIYGKGGHGAVPNQAIDPVVLASQYVLAIQTIVSRNLPPSDPAVITIGAIHGGSAGNVIPEQVELRLTIRSYSEAARTLIFDRLKTIGNHLALAAGLSSDKLPKFDLLDMSIPSVYNTPQLGEKLRSILQTKLGAESFTTVLPIMIGEDFGIYGRQPGKIPSYIVWMGTVSKENKLLEAQGKTSLPSLHSSRFGPDYENTLPKAVNIMGEAILGLFTVPSKK